MLIGVWVAAAIVGGLLADVGALRAGRLFAGSLLALVGLALLTNWRGFASAIAAANARGAARWALTLALWQRSEHWVRFVARIFGALNLVVGVALIGLALRL